MLWSEIVPRPTLLWLGFDCLQKEATPEYREMKKKWKFSFFFIKDMHCPGVLTFLSHFQRDYRNHSCIGNTFLYQNTTSKVGVLPIHGAGGQGT